MFLLGVVMLVLLAVGWSVGANMLRGSLEEFDQNDSAIPATTPQQIHIAYGSSPSKMLISWSTYANKEEGDSSGSTQSIVIYGKVVAGEDKNPTAEASSSRQTSIIMAATDVSFTINNPNGAQWVHRARLTVINQHFPFLESNQIIIFAGTLGIRRRLRLLVSCAHRKFVKSGILFPDSQEGKPMGNQVSCLWRHGTSGWRSNFALLKRRSISRRYRRHHSCRRFCLRPSRRWRQGTNFVKELYTCLHWRKIGDLFMRRIEPIAARVPYMTCVGNHEIEHGTYAHYRYLFFLYLIRKLA